MTLATHPINTESSGLYLGALTVSRGRGSGKWWDRPHAASGIDTPWTVWEQSMKRRESDVGRLLDMVDDDGSNDMRVVYLAAAWAAAARFSAIDVVSHLKLSMVQTPVFEAGEVEHLRQALAGLDEVLSASLASHAINSTWTRSLDAATIEVSLRLALRAELLARYEHLLGPEAVEKVLGYLDGDLLPDGDKLTFALSNRALSLAVQMVETLGQHPVISAADGSAVSLQVRLSDGRKLFVELEDEGLEAVLYSKDAGVSEVEASAEDELLSWLRVNL